MPDEGRVADLLQWNDAVPFPATSSAYVEVIKEGKIISKVSFSAGQKAFVIGRLPECDLQMEHPSVSRQHAVFHYNAASKSFFVTDLGSVHGTFLNKIKIPSEQRMRLSSGDCIRFAQSTRLVVFTDLDADPTTLNASLNENEQQLPSESDIVKKCRLWLDDYDYEIKTSKRQSPTGPLFMASVQIALTQAPTLEDERRDFSTECVYASAAEAKRMLMQEVTDFLVDQELISVAKDDSDVEYAENKAIWAEQQHLQNEIDDETGRSAAVKRTIPQSCTQNKHACVKSREALLEDKQELIKKIITLNTQIAAKQRETADTPSTDDDDLDEIFTKYQRQLNVATIEALRLDLKSTQQKCVEIEAAIKKTQ